MTSAHRLAVLTAVLTTAGTALSGCGSEGQRAPSRALSQAECRQAWADESQMLGENGNPARPGTVLADRYDELDAVAAQLATRAEAGDCPGKLEEYRARLATTSTWRSPSASTTWSTGSGAPRPTCGTRSGCASTTRCRKDAARELAAAAEDSAAYQRCMGALDVIGEFELDEE